MPSNTMEQFAKKLEKIRKKRNLSRKNILGINDLSIKDIELIFDVAKVFKEDFVLPGEKKMPILKGRTIINFFVETSTRTRTSFEIAGKELGADVINISADSSSMAKKNETLHDTIRTLGAMETDLIVVRHSEAGAPKIVAEALGKPVINAGDGWHEHPTQGLLDAYTITEKLGALKGKEILIVGDILHSRVFGSVARVARKLGAKVRVASPPTMVPKEVEKEFKVKVFYNIEEAIKNVDVVYALRVQIERAANSYIPSLREYSKLFNITPMRLALAKPGAIVMHPGPVNRDIDISNDVMRMPQCVVEDEVANGYCVRLALLYLILN